MLKEASDLPIVPCGSSLDVPGGLGVDEGGVRMLPVVADHVVDPDARDLVGLAEAKQRAGHALRAAEL